ncbi:MAG TPA: glycosyltransferase family 25 protein [Castellaniella sp.]|uniref:glycosyltransferase family 25 protein n=1 Tax=Castellaniella sp. TaxID=1955812 RepID=UPI002EF8ABA4
MSPVPIRVISLASRPDRRAQIASQLGRLELADYRFLDAVNGKAQPDHPLFAHYDPVARRRIKGRGRDLMPSQLGCFASHYLLWQECVSSAQPMIVLEDDAILGENFNALRRCAGELAARWPLVWLNEYDKAGKQDAYVQVEHVASFDLVRKLKGHSCTVAYLINPVGAARLLAYCASWIYPVDDTMFRFYAHGVGNYAVHPACVTQDYEIPSDIRGAAQPPPLSWADIVRREAYQVRDDLWRMAYNVRLRARRVIS